MDNPTAAARPAPAVSADRSLANVVGYQPFIEGIRGGLATYVVLYHIYTVIGYIFCEGDVADTRGLFDWLIYGHSAVVAFIFVSGLCLGMPAVRNLENSGIALRRGTLAFYKGRARRILPAYYAAIILCCSLAWFVKFSQVHFPPTYFLPVENQPLIGALLLIPNLVGSHNGAGVIWSLGVELQIYLIFPLLCLIWQRYGIGTLFCVVLVAASVARSCFPRYFAGLTIIGGQVTGLCPTLYVSFTIGLVAAVLFTGSSETVRRIREATPWGRLLITLVVVTLIRGIGWGAAGEVEDYFTAIFMLVLVMAIQRHRWLRWIFERPIPVQVGTFSYSLYLTHLAMLNVIYLFIYKPFWPKSLQGNLVRAVMFEVAIGLPIMCIVAYGFARIFEWPFMGNIARRAVAESYQPQQTPAATIAIDPPPQKD